MLLLQFSDIKLLHPRRSGSVSVFLTNGACRSFKTVDQKKCQCFQIIPVFFQIQSVSCFFCILCWFETSFENVCCDYSGLWSETAGDSRTFKVITLFSGKFVFVRVPMVMCCFLFFLFYGTVLFYFLRISLYPVSATSGSFIQLFVSTLIKIVLAEILVITGCFFLQCCVFYSYQFLFFNYFLYTQLIDLPLVHEPYQKDGVQIFDI